MSEQSWDRHLWLLRFFSLCIFQNIFPKSRIPTNFSKEYISSSFSFCRCSFFTRPFSFPSPIFARCTILQRGRRMKSCPAFWLAASYPWEWLDLWETVREHGVWPWEEMPAIHPNQCCLCSCSGSKSMRRNHAFRVCLLLLGIPERVWFKLQNVQLQTFLLQAKTLQPTVR